MANGSDDDDIKASLSKLCPSVDDPLYVNADGTSYEEKNTSARFDKEDFLNDEDKSVGAQASKEATSLGRHKTGKESNIYSEVVNLNSTVPEKDTSHDHELITIKTECEEETTDFDEDTGTLLKETELSQNEESFECKEEINDYDEETVKIANTDSIDDSGTIVKVTISSHIQELLLLDCKEETADNDYEDTEAVNPLDSTVDDYSIIKETLPQHGQDTYESQKELSADNNYGDINETAWSQRQELLECKEQIQQKKKRKKENNGKDYEVRKRKYKIDSTAYSCDPILKETVPLHDRETAECQEALYPIDTRLNKASVSGISWDTNLYDCKLCDTKFSDINSLREHCKSLHQVCNGFRCRECSIELADFDTFVSHHREHRPELEGFCQFCNMELKSAGAGHVASHGDLFCKFCGEVFTSASGFKEHYLLYAPEAENNGRSGRGRGRGRGQQRGGRARGRGRGRGRGLGHGDSTATLRETSKSRSPSATPPPHSQRPSAARRALLMGLALQGPDPHPTLSPPRTQTAITVESTPGSLSVGEGVPILKTPGHVRLRKPMTADAIVEVVEAMDLDDEEAEEVIDSHPWHVQRWIRGLEGQGDSPREDNLAYTLSKPLTPSISAEVFVDNVASIASVHTHNTSNAMTRPNSDSAEVRPSVSGMTATRKRNAGREACAGSEMDSDHDDEFDMAAIDFDAFTHQGRIARDIPNSDDEELEEPTRTMIEAVERAMDDEADRLLLGVSTSYTWEEDFDLFRGVPEIFSGPTPGPIEDYDTPYDAFTDIWSNDIIEHIVQETNRYAKQTIDSKKASGTLGASSRLHEWVDTDADEMMVFFAVFMYMGIDSRSSQTEYWRANDCLEMPKFKQLMTYNRFILLNKFLHFIDNTDVSQCSQQSGGNSFSKKLAKLQPVISHLEQKFSSLYNLSKEICIDESLTLFKGRLPWVQTIRTKAARFGIKSYELCESKTGYLYKFEIYTGKESGDASSASATSEDLAGKSTAVVLKLLKDLERRGHCVTMDNFYNCPALARYLKSLKFDCLGTLRKNRRNVPESINKIRENVAKGRIIARHCGDVSIIAWRDSKLVTMISTYHNDETYVGSKAGKPVVKPVCVRDYNNTMGGVDLKDKILSMYLLERKRCVKWYMKIFKRLLNVSIHNAFIMYGSSLRRRDRLPMTHREFRYDLAKSLFERHRRLQPQIREQIGEIMRLRRDVVHVPKYEHGPQNRKRCVVCYRQNKETKVRTQCVTCDEFLCFEGCWTDWHSLTELRGKERRRKMRRTVQDNCD